MLDLEDYMTCATLRSLILKRLDELERWYADDDPDPARVVAREHDVILEVADGMARAGFPRLYAIGRDLRIDIESKAVKTYLSRCLRALRPKRRAGSKAAVPDANMLTPPEVAQRYGVSPDTVRAWITSGDLRAVNISRAKRPRYRVPVEALNDLDVKRLPRIASASPAQRRRRAKPAGLIVTRFSCGR
jgi:excisionase family DNA binding protein